MSTALVIPHAGGACFNPARALGPVFATGDFENKRKKRKNFIESPFLTFWQVGICIGPCCSSNCAFFNL